MKQGKNDREKPNQGYTKTILLAQVVLKPQPLPGGVVFWGSTTTHSSSTPEAVAAAVARDETME